MKSAIMLVCAMVASMSLSALAVETNAAAGGDKNRAKHGEMTEAQREAMMNKRLESIKEKDPALYKELIDLKAKDPVAFKAKMAELRKQQHAQGAAGAPAAPAK